ncbi:uncharacterized protein EHS24_004231 [Apiotrichum porosum]|uniref:Uncharacterized protein n=1 Tax=Apiotrichum porosum TaxID=105984 RepID=A0A427Y4M7_9TREE|nr:uncharacterized protein EHS24_004231 [Apiotrichum porosum]RSH86032.1 hypothetical protein EHS24_004231 [Apiotrichum porosum]
MPRSSSATSMLSPEIGNSLDPIRCTSSLSVAPEEAVVGLPTMGMKAHPSM